MFLSINDHFNLFKYSIAYIRSRNNLLTFLLTLNICLNINETTFHNQTRDQYELGKHTIKVPNDLDTFQTELN